MPPIGAAIAAFKITVIDVHVIRAEIRQAAAAGRNADAMRPRVIRVDIDAAAKPALAGKLKSVRSLSCKDDSRC